MRRIARPPKATPKRGAKQPRRMQLDQLITGLLEAPARERRATLIEHQRIVRTRTRAKPTIRARRVETPCGNVITIHVEVM